MTNIREWKHVFKLDPDKTLSDDHLERVCMSGTHAVLVGGSTGVTFDNTVDLLSRIRRYEVPCALEVSNPEAIVPGFDLYLVPVVLNSTDPRWIVGHHQAAVREFGSVIPWDRVIVEGYIILNADCSAAKMTKAQTGLAPADVEAYVRMADKLFGMPVVYLEYSGMFGDMDLLGKAAGVVGEARLFYGGGIDGPDKARLAAGAAHTIVVGNAVYENLDMALRTVEVLHS